MFGSRARIRSSWTEATVAARNLGAGGGGRALRIHLAAPTPWCFELAYRLLFVPHRRSLSISVAAKPTWQHGGSVSVETGGMPVLLHGDTHYFQRCRLSQGARSQ